MQVTGVGDVIKQWVQVTDVGQKKIVGTGNRHGKGDKRVGTGNRRGTGEKSGYR